MSYIIPLVTKKRIQNKEVMYETVIYADVLFGINLVANLCVLLITDWIFKFSARISRMIISATLGAVWAVICVCIPLRFALLEKFITYVPVTLIMAMIMLSGTKDFKQKTSKQLKLYMRNLLKAGAGMILIALFAGGIMHWLKYTFAGYFIENVILSDSELVIFLTVTVIVVVIVLKTLKTIRITDGLKRHIVIGVSGREFCIFEGVSGRTSAGRGVRGAGGDVSRVGGHAQVPARCGGSAGVLRQRGGRPA